MKRCRAEAGFMLLVFVISCAACAQSIKPLSLSESMEEFNDALRWKRNQKAARFVVPMHRLNFVREQEEKGEGRRITEYRIVELSRVDAKTASATVQWEYIPVASPVVVKERSVQFWTQVGGEWFLLRIEAEKKDREPGKKVAPEAGDHQRNQLPR